MKTIFDKTKMTDTVNNAQARLIGIGRHKLEPKFEGEPFIYVEEARQLMADLLTPEDISNSATAIVREESELQANDVLLAEQIKGIIDDEIKSYYGCSTHGNCCTCGKCKNYHDDCMCAEIDALNKLKSKFSK